jgi:hypothetical protein
MVESCFGFWCSTKIFFFDKSEEDLSVGSEVENIAAFTDGVESNRISIKECFLFEVVHCEVYHSHGKSLFWIDEIDIISVSLWRE